LAEKRREALEKRLKRRERSAASGPRYEDCVVTGAKEACGDARIRSRSMCDLRGGRSAGQTLTGATVHVKRRTDQQGQNGKANTRR
jgi:hypothetical protein